MKKEKKKGLSNFAWYFLGIIVLSYLILLLLHSHLFLQCIIFSAHLLIKLVAVFILVFVLMTLANYFITKQFITRHLQTPGIKKWLFAVIGGIISTGPIYLWYPLLKDLRDKGLGYGYLATFLYNRAIKIPLLPLAILYFGLKYIALLTLLMIIVSIIQGILINKFVPLKQ